MLPALVVAVEEVPEGEPSARVLAGDGATISVVYGGEQEGRVGTCGCGAYPKGGLARVRTMTDAIRAADPDLPVLLLNPGGFLASDNAEDQLAPEAVATNGYFHRALAEVRYDVLNVTWRDLPGLGHVPHPGLVSATHAPMLPTKVVDAKGLRVVITGVSRRGPPYLEPAATEYREPLEALRALELHDEDLVVVLVFDLPREAQAIASLPGVDVVIEADDYVARYDPVVVGDALWVRSWDESTRLGELRLWVEEGRVVRALDRMIDLGPDVDEHPRLDRIARDQARGR